jgi:Rrf2 family transcriptional regulator, nitric oxide-sensitive transcriptional repressor
MEVGPANGGQMISQSAEYSLRAVLCLATSQPGQAMTTQQIADRARVPAGYLAKVLQTLGRSGIVTSQRGLNGGFSLAVAPGALTLLAVVSAVEPSRRITECPIGHPDHAVNLCPLHRRLDAAAAGVERMLRETTVADVLAESLDQPLCKHDDKHDEKKEGCPHAGHDCSGDRSDAQRGADRAAVHGGRGGATLLDPAAILLD